MMNFKTGDLVAKKHPKKDLLLKTGLIISHNKDTFTVKWTSFDKVFFMEKEDDIFKELNKTFLLGTVQVHRANTEANLLLLNPS